MIFFSSIQHRKKIFLLLGIFAVIALVLLLDPVTVHAQGVADDLELSKITRNMQHYFTVMLNAMSMILWPVIYIVGGLLDNDLIFGGAMGDALLNIWTQVRNMVNIIFVLILLAVAIYNVLSLGEQGPQSLQSLQLKTVLPKFVIGLLIVNFSFFGAKMFLNFTGVLTEAVFALPTNFTQVDLDRQNFENSICSGPEAPLAGYFCESKAGDGDAAATYIFNKRATEFFDAIDSKNISLAMAVNLGKLPQQKFVGQKVQGILQLTFNMIFGLVMYAIYLVSYVTLLILLIGRLAVMWVSVALSPIMALTIVLPGIGEKLGGGSLNIGDKFMKHALAPLIIGLFMSIGYIMLDTFNNLPTAANGYFSAVPLDALDPNALTSGIADLQQLLIAAACAVIVFTGVFAATEGTVTSFITDKIRDGTKEFGTFLAKLPMYGQFIPVAKGESVSPMQLFATMQQAKRDFERKFGDAIGGTKNPEVDYLAGASTPKEFFRRYAENPGVIADPRAEGMLRDNIKKETRKDVPVREGDTEGLAAYMFGDEAPAELKLALRGKDQRTVLAEIEKYRREKLTAAKPKGEAGAGGGASPASGTSAAAAGTAPAPAEAAKIRAATTELERLVLRPYNVAQVETQLRILGDKQDAELKRIATAAKAKGPLKEGWEAFLQTKGIPLELAPTSGADATGTTH